MQVRPSKQDDFEEICKAYTYAREFMVKIGNPTQWGSTYPEISEIQSDIENGLSLVAEEDDVLCGVFVFFVGDDPTYREIDGAWLNDKPYGVIHRIAGNGKKPGVLHAALEYGFEQVDNIRIDTHKDNVVMRHLLEKEGFSETGIIICHNGTPRVAYQKEK